MKHLFITLILSMSTTALAKSDYPASVDAAAKSLYGASASFTADCAGCHGQNRDIPTNGTGFGKDLLAAAVTKGISGTNISPSQMQTLIAFIEGKDSDGDGATNKQELTAGSDPGSSSSAPVLCVRANPSVTISPSSQSGAPGAILNYSFSVKNNDSAACSSSTFNIGANPNAGLSIELAMQSVVLSSGQSATVAVKSTSQLGLANSTLSFSIGAQNAGATTYQASTVASYVVVNPTVPVCSRAAPSLSLSPSSQSDYAGGTLSYQATLKNQDSVECAASTFSLTLAAAAPLSGTLSSSSLILNPGQSQTFNISMKSAVDSVPGSLSFSVDAKDAAVSVHAVNASGTYIVKSPADTAAPSVPANVTVVKAKGGFMISWNPSTDNIGVVSYKIYVDDVLKSETTSTSAKVRIRRGTHKITVTAVDASGNESVASVPVEVVAGK